MGRILEIAYENQKKYGKPPTWEQIEELINEVGITKYHFEKFYGIPFNHLAKVKTGAKQLGRNYWHIFYEKIKMPFGVGFEGVYEALYKINNVTKNLPKSVPNKIPNKTSSGDKHGRLGNIK